MPDAPTLREILTARRAIALIENAAAAAHQSTPTSAEIAASTPGGGDLPAAKLELLRASLASYDIQEAALRMTGNEARAIISSATRKSRARPAQETTSDGLTSDDLDTMTEGSWAECAHWLAGQAGFAPDERPLLVRENLLAWRGHVGGPSGAVIIVCALRRKALEPLAGEDLRHLATIASNEPGARLAAMTTHVASVGAIVAARDLKAELFDREAIDRLFASQATAFARERAQSRNDAKAQAKAATAARKKLLSALTAADTQCKAALPPQRADGRAAVRKAVEQAREAQRLAGQALMAWETLVAEWSATFGERPARDGSLPLMAEVSTWTDLAARADHLKKPLLDALRALAKAPGDGDLGYGAWRQALGEELAARCSALLWRVNLVDPDQWQDFASAVNDIAVREASRADNAAAHAAARAERAQSQMAERAGVA